MINIGGDAKTLQVEGREHTREYRAMVERDGKPVESRHRRVFCGHCGSHVWAYHDAWPELVHPVAAAIDTPLPRPPACVHMMLGSAAPWVNPPIQAGDEAFDEYPRLSLAGWHAEHGYIDPVSD